MNEDVFPIEHGDTVLFHCYISLPDPYNPCMVFIIIIFIRLLDFYGFHVGKYTSPMDAMGVEGAPKTGSITCSIRGATQIRGPFCAKTTQTQRTGSTSREVAGNGSVWLVETAKCFESLKGEGPYTTKMNTYMHQII